MQPIIDFNGLDTAVHGPLRLGVLTVLQLDGPHDFTTLKKRLDAVDGSLSLQLQKLEEVEYVKAEKAFVGRRPKTTYTLTKKGRSALAQYLDTLKTLLVAMGRIDE
jgi:DNA-binding HxlR family transcriptional regulator